MADVTPTSTVAGTSTDDDAHSTRNQSRHTRVSTAVSDAAITADDTARTDEDSVEAVHYRAASAPRDR